MDTIEKICEALQCQPGDVLQYVKITELKNSNGKLDEDILVETPFLDEDSSMEIQERSNYLKMVKWINAEIYIYVPQRYHRANGPPGDAPACRSQ